MQGVYTIKITYSYLHIISIDITYIIDYNHNYTMCGYT